jgi:hypothetical protein
VFIEVKRRYEWVAVAVIVVLAIAVISITTYNLLVKQTARGPTQTTSEPFVVQPVVDVIIPSLFRQGPTGGINSPLNLTVGQNESIQIEIYSSVHLNASMEFNMYALSTSQQASLTGQMGNASVNWEFNPILVNVPVNGKANTTLSLNVSSQTATGTYNAVVTAVNSDNSTQMWGDIFEIVIAD